MSEENKPEDNKAFTRWYDKDPVVSKCFEIMEHTWVIIIKLLK